MTEVQPDERGVRRHGTAATMLGAAMFGLRDVLERRRDDQPAAVAESPGGPGDIDTDGLSLRLGGVEMSSPALPPSAIGHLRQPRRRRKRRWAPLTLRQRA